MSENPCRSRVIPNRLGVCQNETIPAVAAMRQCGGRRLAVPARNIASGWVFERIFAVFAAFCRRFANPALYDDSPVVASQGIGRITAAR